MALKGASCGAIHKLMDLKPREDTHILLVDDEEAVRRMLHKVLDRQGYRCIVARSYDEALQRMSEQAFDLVLTDMDMPGRTGLDLLMKVSTEHPGTASILITGYDDEGVAATALELGAYAYLVKPFESNEFLVGVASSMRRRAAEGAYRNQMERLEQMVRHRTEEMWNYVAQLEQAEKGMRSLQEETIERLSMAAEFRDDETPRHIQRMSRYCSLIADRIGDDAERCELIRVAGAMHDVGKMGIPDAILQKPGKLDEDEWEIMKRHCEIGHRILSGTTSEVMNTAALIALTHHERVDGSGYPQGLRGDEIPLEGKIAAIADVFDALTSNNVYRAAFPIGEAVEMMEEGRGTQFDAEFLDLFLGSLNVVIGIKERYADGVPNPV
jgi:putative two-component system response regulator